MDWNSELTRLKVRVESCPTPHVMGIHGSWGSGKTSFMRQLQSQLGGKCNDIGSMQGEAGRVIENKKIVTIWFDAWRYQNELNPIVALIQEMRRQFSLVASVKSKFKKVGDISLRYTLDGLGEIGKAIGFESLANFNKIQEFSKEWDAENGLNKLDCDSIREHLHQTIVALLPKEQGSRVVVFVDDLDRCHPKAAFKLLEGLKIYFNIPNCVFVLGMNEDVLTEVISSEVFPGIVLVPGEKHLRAGHYFEKICTDVYRLPLPRSAMALFSAMLYTVGKSEHVAALDLALDDRAELPPNPRRLKALANQWIRFSGCIPFPERLEDQKIWSVRVLIAAYIHQFHRDMWERWHFNSDFWLECKAWCCGERSVNQDGADISPPWASHLQLNNQKPVGDSGSNPSWAKDYPNPGSINIFWIDGVIRAYRDFLSPVDFTPLLLGRQYEDGL